MTLDLYSYYALPTMAEDVVHCCPEQPDFVFDLASVIVHHGVGLSSGHYTAYCWNSDAGIPYNSWVQFFFSNSRFLILQMRAIQIIF